MKKLGINELIMLSPALLLALPLMLVFVLSNFTDNQPYLVIVPIIVAGSNMIVLLKIIKHLNDAKSIPSGDEYRINEVKKE